MSTEAASIDPGLANEASNLAQGVGGVFAPEAAPAHKPRRMHYGDAIRIIGTFAVVIGHVADLRLFSDHVLDGEWWICNLWDSLTRWAVPVYIMLSGALLLDPGRAEAPRDFYRKRLGRIGVPLVFWTAAFMWFSVEYTGWASYESFHGWKAAWLLLDGRKPYFIGNLTSLVYEFSR